MKSIRSKYILSGFFSSALLFGLGGISNIASADNGELSQLREQLSGLTERIAELEQAEQHRAERQAKVTAGARGVRVESPDGTYNFRVNGLVQLDSRWYLNSEARGRDGNSGFDLRRVRPTIQGQLGNGFGFRITPELSGTVRILDAYGDLPLSDSTSLRFGNFKAPVGLERLQGGGNLLFNERGFATEFTPARDLGIQTTTTLANRKVTLIGGIFNGAVDGSGGAPSNPDGEFTFAGSVFFQPFRNDSDSALRGLGFGISGAYGEREGAASFRVRSPSRLDVAVNNAIQEDGNFYRINPALYYYTGPFGVIAEYIESRRELGLAGGPFNSYRNRGWTLAGSYFLTGENNSYGAVRPKNAFSGFGNGGGGAWELALRYTGVSVDNDLFSNGLLNANQARQANAFGIGLNWYLTDNLKALFGFEHTTYSGGGGAGGGDRSSDNTALTRLQVAF